MAVDDIVIDEELIPLLHASKSALEQALKTIDWLLNQPAADTTLEQQLELSQRQKVLNSHLAKLRGQSRRTAFAARETKTETADARQQVDRLLLQLQNLYYEQRHLKGEIGACEGYDHAFTHLPLLPVESYINLYPEDANLGEQDLMPKRIEHEKREREKMEEQRLELVKVKEGLLKENTRRKEEMKKMDEKLEAMLDSLAPLEEALSRDL